MRRVSQFVRDYQDSGAMSTLINLYGFVDDGMFLTKSGDLGLVMALSGVDYECLDAGQRDGIEAERRHHVRVGLQREHLARPAR